ncbi:MAG: Ig-like domain repeat protein [Solirubrobacterales bacterium]|nr:Ig-like domain repeat protein [Solirubrobacterales bacterium]
MASATAASDGPTTTPTGTVSFFPNGPGSFNGTSPCTLSGTGGSASCSATFTPSGVEPGGNTGIMASYGGGPGHEGSSNITTVTVTVSAPGPTARSTSTSVTCVPGSVTVRQATKCTVKVSDPAGSGQNTPTGTVIFTSSGPGSFSADSCALSHGTGGSASCSVTYTPSAVGTGLHTITATYGGDSVHLGSRGATTVRARVEKGHRHGRTVSLRASPQIR